MSSMQALIEGFADQLKQAVQIGQTFRFPDPAAPVRQVVVVGLGGSAFGGEIVRNYAFAVGDAPVLIYRGYDAPAFVASDTLVIVSSYSGNTEETLSAAEQCLAKGARLVCVSSGGKLQEFAAQNNLPFILLPAGYPPRTACGFSIVQQLFILRHYGLIPDFEADLQETISLIENFDRHAEARSIAQNLTDRIPVIYSSDAIDAVSIRLRQQINENAKQLCWHHVVPEMNHNELVGWELPRFVVEKAVVLMLYSHYDHPRVRVRMDINSQLIREKGGEIIAIAAEGQSLLAQLLTLLHLSDWISLYLAEANHVDPTPVKVIDFLKNELASR